MDVPIKSTTADFSALSLFQQVQAGDYQALQAAGKLIGPALDPAPSLSGCFDKTLPFKFWFDPVALTAPATPGPDPLSGIWYLDGTNVLYPLLTYTTNPDGSCNVTMSHLWITRAEAAAINCPNPASAAFGYYYTIAKASTTAPLRPVPFRPLQPCESLHTANPQGIATLYGATGPVVWNSTLIAAQQAAAQSAAATPVAYSQRDRDMLQFLAAHFLMQGVTAPPGS